MPGTSRSITATLAWPIGLGLVLPVLVAATDPWRRRTEAPSLIIGAVVTISGLAMVIQAGRAVTATEPGRLVTRGLFAHSRNPIHLGVLAMLAGLSMASRSPVLGLYLLTAVLGLHLWVLRHREPLADSIHGERWRHYRSSVPRWLPRTPVPGRRR